ncbi:MAG: cation diffusion facilitator family transporter [Planctomycetota bacterium]
MSSSVADPQPRSHVGAALLSLIVAGGLLAAKFWAYSRTNSQAIFSDALESIVNVVAALMALTVVRYAVRPADRDHPYGHGKVEFFSAAFEGGLIFCAALVIMWQSAVALIEGSVPRELDFGVVVTLLAGLANGALGLYLVRYGRRHDSVAIVADGQHVLSDFWTSLGVVVGLLVVRVTGIAWLDPLIAAVMMVWLLITGWGIVRRAIDGLLDAEDPELLQQVVEVLSPHVGNGIIRMHHLRAIRSGSFRHISAHLVVPEFWSVQRAHDESEQLAADIVDELPWSADVDFHTDPCERTWCSMCDLETCSVRREPFVGLEPLTVDEAVLPDELLHEGELHHGAQAGGQSGTPHVPPQGEGPRSGTGVAS